MIIKIISALILALGTLCIFDARRIARRFFTLKNRNETTLIIQNIGVILVIVAFILFIYFGI